MKNFEENFNVLMSDSMRIDLLEKRNRKLTCKLGQSESYIQELEFILGIKGPNDLDKLETISEVNPNLLKAQVVFLTRKLKQYESILKQNNLL